MSRRIFLAVKDKGVVDTSVLALFTVEMDIVVSFGGRVVGVLVVGGIVTTASELMFAGWGRAAAIASICKAANGTG
jgi:hypothetical protein